MSLISLLVALMIIGILLYLMNTYIPMAQPIKTIINIIVVFVALIYALSALGIFHGPLIKIR